MSQCNMRKVFKSKTKFKIYQDYIPSEMTMNIMKLRVRCFVF
jgi:hypothetical protein